MIGLSANLFRLQKVYYTLLTLLENLEYEKSGRLLGNPRDPCTIGRRVLFQTIVIQYTYITLYVFIFPFYLC
jgi:hypothetical protein